MKKISKTLILLLFATSQLFSQNENNNWMFGDNCGITFNPFSTFTSFFTPPNPPLEGVASISDENGDLLFYTDGIRAYNRSFAVMTNGTGLLGNPSSTSSAIIVPKPCSNTEYYIFAIDFINGQNGVTYSLVNMDDNGDCFVSASETGRVVATMKNISLPGPTGERICAVKKGNDLDYWVIATETNTNNFYIYEVTELGVNQMPIQTTGSNLSHGGYMKASPDGTKIGLTDFSSQSVFLYDFASGLIGAQILVGTTPILPYGLEFSPNSQKMYYSDIANSNGTGTGRIYEVDICPTVGTPFQIGTIPNQGGRYACGALQLTPENPQRILIAKDGESSLAAISNPDIGCIPPASGGTGNPTNFNPNAIALTNTCYLGLPTFVSGQIERCKPLDMFNYRQAVPDLFSNIIKTEIITDGFTGLDKEYDDIDDDGDVDILFTINNTLHYFENTGGYCNPPNYSNPSISLSIDNCYSFRLYDWDGILGKDLIIHGTPNGTDGVFLYLNNGTGVFPSIPTMILDGTSGTGDFAFEPQQLIEVGDLNHDGLPDILISGQGAIYGTHYFENPTVSTFNAIMIPDNSGSYHCPELYDADCQNGVDILLSDPLFGSPNSGGARMYFHENSGIPSVNQLPNINTTGLTNQFGFNDIPQSTNIDLSCDWVITRIVDFYNDNCPIAISYNPCRSEIFFYYQQNCVCSNQNFFVSTENSNEEEAFIRVFPNPSNDFINVTVESDITIQSFSIFSVEGRLIRTEEYKNQAISVNRLNSGVCFLNIQTSKGSISKKIIIK